MYMKRMQKPIGVLAVTLTLGLTAPPLATAGGGEPDCWNFDNYWEEDWPSSDDKYHLWEGGEDPEEQEPWGEWEWAGTDQRLGAPLHSDLDENWAFEAGHDIMGSECNFQSGAGGGGHEN